VRMGDNLRAQVHATLSLGHSGEFTSVGEPRPDGHYGITADNQPAAISELFKIAAYIEKALIELAGSLPDA